MRAGKPRAWSCRSGAWHVGGRWIPRCPRTGRRLPTCAGVAPCIADDPGVLAYSLFPESWRFSRGVVLMLPVLHGVVHGLVLARALKRSRKSLPHSPRLLVAQADLGGMAELLRRNEGERVRLTMHALWAGESDPQEWPQLQGVPWVGRIRDVAEAVQIHNVDEVVFSGKDVKAHGIHRGGPAHVGPTHGGQMPHRLDRRGGRDVERRGVPRGVCGVSARIASPRSGANQEGF